MMAGKAQASDDARANAFTVLALSLFVDNE
jgi:hypothetical protein